MAQKHTEENIEMPKDFRPSDYGIYNDDGQEGTEEEIGEMSEDYRNAPLLPQEDLPESEEHDSEY